MGHNDQATLEMIEAVRRIAAKSDYEPACWISGPDGDNGQDWCARCGRFKVRNMRRRDRRRGSEYCLDGGWLTEMEHFPFCAGCGGRLDCIILKYGIMDTVWHFSEYGFTTEPDQDAWEIQACLEQVEYVSPDEDDQIRETRTKLIELTRQFLAQTGGQSDPTLALT